MDFTLPNSSVANKEREVISYKDIGEKRKDEIMTVSKKKRARTEKGKLKKKKVEQQIRLSLDFIQCSNIDLDLDLPECLVNLTAMETFDGRQLQNLLLWLLGDGVNPTMVMVRKKTQIKQVILIHVPGLSPIDLINLTDDEKNAHFTLKTQFQPIYLGNDKLDEDPRYITSQFIPELNEFKNIFKTIIPLEIPVRRRCFERMYEFLLRLSPSMKIRNKVQSSTQETVAEWTHKYENGTISRADAFQLFRMSQESMSIHNYPDRIHSDPLYTTETEELSNIKVEWHKHKNSNLSHFSIKPLFNDQFRVLAIDCEMVLTEHGDEAARMSVVDESLTVVFDKIFKPTGAVIDYRTKYSGITKELVDESEFTLESAQLEFIQLFNKFQGETFLVGHSLENDLKAIRLYYNRVIDTALLYDGPSAGLKNSLKYLTSKFLGKQIQNGSHDSVIDATCTMELFLLKLKNGPTFGARVVMYEPLWQRINRANGRLAAVIDRPERLKQVGESAWKSIEVHSDEDATEKAIQKISESKSFMTWLSLDRLTCLSSIEEGKRGEVFTAFQSNVKAIYDALPSESVVVIFSGIGKVDKLFKSQLENQLVLKKSNHALVGHPNELFDGFTYMNGTEMGTLAEQGIAEARLGALMFATKQ